ncbi:MAG: Carboxypeptidase, partial [Propionibacterium sp. DORA_15]
MPAWVPVLVGVAVTGIVVLVVVVSSLRTGTSTNEAERGLLTRRHGNTAPAVQPGRGVV